MKMIIVLAAVLAMAVALPYDASKTAQVLKYENDNIGVDGYKYAYVKGLSCCPGSPTNNRPLIITASRPAMASPRLSRES